MQDTAHPESKVRLIIAVVLFCALPIVSMIVVFVAVGGAAAFLIGGIDLMRELWHSAQSRYAWPIFYFALFAGMIGGLSLGCMGWYLLVYSTGFITERQAENILRRPEIVPFAESTLGRRILRALRKPKV